MVQGERAEAVERVADAAEALGFDGVSVQDHILSTQGVSPCGHRHIGDDRMVLEPFATLAYVAARTKRVDFVTGVIVLPFRNPLWVAKTGGAVDVLSNGRLQVLGVGVGSPKSQASDSDPGDGPPRRPGRPRDGALPPSLDRAGR